MTSVSQHITNYFGGISEQPDSLKKPGQVKNIVNAIPDITWGLYKRPGSKRVIEDPITAVQSNGSWFHYFRDEVEGSYIGQIDKDGKVRVWSCKDGLEKTVHYSQQGSAYDSSNIYHTNITNYLTPSSETNTEDIQTLTINDTTYIVNRTKEIKTEGTTPGKPHPYAAYVEILRTENGRQYGLNISTPDGARDDTLDRATRLKIKSDTLDEATGSGSCPGIGTQVFSATANIVNSDIVQIIDTNGDRVYSGKTNLVFRLTTLGQVSTVEGSTNSFKCTYNREVDLLHGGEGWVTGDKVTAIMSQAQSNYEYEVIVEDHETAILKADVKIVRPAPTPFDADTAVTLDTILGGMQTELDGITIGGHALNTEIIGNGLYLSCNVPFNVEGTDADLMRVMQSDINDVENLPNQCKHGYIAKVTNARIAEEDDYYLQFIGESNSSGVGSWVECAAPGIIKSFDKNTMPHILQRLADGTFLVKPSLWADRTVGDDATNQAPSFVGVPTYTSAGVATYSEDRKINKVLFFRNRLAFLSGENVILSRPGEFTSPNFWAETALTTSAIDPIDISSSSMFPSDLFDGIEVTVGMIVFSSNQQFLLSSDDTVLNPDTAKLKSISSYSYNTDIPPIALGMSVGYIDNSGKYSRFNEMSLVERERDPVVVETSKLVPSLLPKNIDLISNSRENQVVFFSQKNSKVVYGFKYLFTGEQRPQTAWFKWEFSNDILYHFIVDDCFYFLDKDYFLQKLNFIQDEDLTVQLDATSIGGAADEEFLVHLDNYISYSPYAGTFNTATNKTNFSLPWLDKSTSIKQIFIVDNDGNYNEATKILDNTVEVTGNWSDKAVNIGFIYDYQVDFPTLYVSSTEDNKFSVDHNASLILHRLKINFGEIGSYRTTLTSKIGKDPYTEIYESSYSDSYNINTVPYLLETIRTIPVYERNTNVNITIKSINPTPATLHSMSWEGDYTQRYYKRV